jgi:hypothetical protein
MLNDSAYARARSTTQVKHRSLRLAPCWQVGSVATVPTIITAAMYPRFLKEATEQAKEANQANQRPS